MSLCITRTTDFDVLYIEKEMKPSRTIDNVQNRAHCSKCSVKGAFNGIKKKSAIFFYFSWDVSYSVGLLTVNLHWLLMLNNMFKSDMC